MFLLQIYGESYNTIVDDYSPEETVHKDYVGYTATQDPFAVNRLMMYISVFTDHVNSITGTYSAQNWDLYVGSDC